MLSKSRTVVPAAVAMALVCAACSGSSHAPSAASAHYASTTSSTALAGGASGGSSTTTAPTTSTTAANHSNPTSPAAGGTSPQSAGTTGSTSPAPGAQPIPPSTEHPPTPAKPGTYPEKQSGSFTVAGNTQNEPPTGKLVVDPATAQGQQTSHYYAQPNQGSQDSTIAFRSNGPFLVSTTESGPNGAVDCTFDPAIPAPPWPTSAGASFSSTGNCGQFQLHVSGRVIETKTVPLDGKSYTVWVVDSTLTATGKITASGQQEDWYSPALRLDLHRSSELQGSYGPFTFKSQLTSDLESANPS